MTYFKAVLWESAPGNDGTTILPEQIVTGIRGDLWRSAIFELDQHLTRSSLQSYCKCTHVSVEVVNCDVYIWTIGKTVGFLPEHLCYVKIVIKYWKQKQFLTMQEVFLNHTDLCVFLGEHKENWRGLEKNLMSLILSVPIIVQWKWKGCHLWGNKFRAGKLYHTIPHLAGQAGDLATYNPKSFCTWAWEQRQNRNVPTGVCTLDWTVVEQPSGTCEGLVINECQTWESCPLRCML